MKFSTIKFTAALLLFACSSFQSVLSISKKTLRARSEKLNVIPLSDSNYTSVVASPQRDYDLLILYNVKSAKFGCSACVPAAKEFKTAAQSYKSHIASLGLKRSLLFVTAYYENSPEAFSFRGIQNVPVVVFHSKEVDDSRYGMALTSHNLNQAIGHIEGTRSADVNAPAILQLAGLDDVAIVRDPGEMQPIATIVAVIAAILSFWVGGKSEKLIFWRNSSFWRVCSIGVYFIATAGVISCVIRGASWFGIDQKGRIDVFESNSGSSQTYSEGIFISSLTIICALCIICLHRLAVHPNRSDWWAAIIGCLLFSCFIAFFLRYLSFYNKKQGWYSFEDLVPTSWQRIFRLFVKQVENIVLKYTGIALPTDWDRKALLTDIIFK